MTTYQLAKLLQMSGGIPSRKRIQKTVHLLQAAGCSLDVGDFRIHYYGPYSASLAEKLDNLAAKKVLVETEELTPVGKQYNYQLDSDLLSSMTEYESSEEGRTAMLEMQRFSSLIAELRAIAPRVLELSSTMVAFYEGTKDWEKAQAQTCEFKGEAPGSPRLREARALAERALRIQDVQH